MKILVAALLSVVIIWLRPAGHTPQHFKNLEATTAAIKTAGQRHSAILTAKPAEPVSEKPAAAPKRETPKPQPVVTPTYPTDCATYEPLVAQYNWDVRVAMAIMQAESHCNPSAVSPAYLNYDGVPDYGLFQIHGEDIINPAANIARAYQKYESQGWYAWSSYNSGEVWQYY